MTIILLLLPIGLFLIFYSIPLSDMERQISLSNDAISSRLAIIEKLQVKLLKRNFGVILPEKLVITSEFPIINYQIWEKAFITYCQEN